MEIFKVYISTPGTAESVYENQFIKELTTDLKVSGIEPTIVDSVEICGCPNKNWLVFECEVDTSGFNWVTFVPFNGKFRGTKSMNKYYFDLFHYGKLILMLQ